MSRGPRDMDVPGFRLEQWSVRVSGSWRIVSRFESGSAVDVDLADYR